MYEFLASDGVIDLIYAQEKKTCSTDIFAYACRVCIPANI